MASYQLLTGLLFSPVLDGIWSISPRLWWLWFKLLPLWIPARSPGATAELFSYSSWFIQKVIPGNKRNEMGKGKSIKCAWMKGLLLWATMAQSQWGTCGEPCRPCLRRAMGQGSWVLIVQFSSLTGCGLPFTHSLPNLGGFACGLSNVQVSQWKPLVREVLKPWSWDLSAV